METTYIKIFTDYLDAIEPLGDAERGRLFTSLLQYARTGEAPQLNGNERFLFPIMKAQIDRDQASYDDVATKRKNAGKAGASRRWNREEAADDSKMANADLLSADDSKMAKMANAIFANSKIANDSKNGNCHQDKDKDKGKDKDKDKDKDDNAPAPGFPDIVLSDGTHFAPTTADVKRWIKSFPAVSVPGELQKISCWCADNPQKRKTRQNIQGFINAWLSKDNRLAAEKQQQNVTWGVGEMEKQAISRIMSMDGGADDG